MRSSRHYRKRWERQITPLNYLRVRVMYRVRPRMHRVRRHLDWRVTATPLRVLYLITDLGKGGAERFLIDLATALRARDDVEFVIGSLYEKTSTGR